VTMEVMKHKTMQQPRHYRREARVRINMDHEKASDTHGP